VITVRGPVLARLCDDHYHELMEAPRGNPTLCEGIETLNDKLAKAMHGMTT
jgi:hypothetical protein